MDDLRAEYERLSGSAADRRWRPETLKAKIKEAGTKAKSMKAVGDDDAKTGAAARYERRDMRVED